MKNDSIREMAKYHAKKAYTPEQRRVAAELARQMENHRMKPKRLEPQEVHLDPISFGIIVAAGVALVGLIVVAVWG